MMSPVEHGTPENGSETPAVRWSDLDEVDRELVKALGAMHREDRLAVGSAVAAEVRQHTGKDWSPPTVYRHLDYLEAMGVASSEPADGRSTRWELSETGWSILRTEARDICYSADLHIEEGQ